MDEVLLGCPRISPQWELDAIQALIKPQLRGLVEHRSGKQLWPRNAARIIDRVWKELVTKVGIVELDSPLHVEAAGEFHAVARFSVRDEALARTYAVALSTALPNTWWVIGRIFVRDGTFFRRERGVKLKLVPARNVFLSRALRLAVRDILWEIQREGPSDHQGARSHVRAERDHRRDRPRATTRHRSKDR